MKYKVKNVTTGEEFLCEKVEVGGFEYYVSKEQALEGDYGYIDFQDGEVNKIGKHFADDWKKVIATTNPSLGLPMVIDEVGELALSEHKYNHKSVQEISFRLGFEVGFNKAKETYQYTKDNMVEFTEWLITKSFREGTSDYTTENLLDLWQEQRTITINVK